MTKLLIYYFVGITGAIAVGLWYNTIVISCIGRLIFIYTGGFIQADLWDFYRKIPGLFSLEISRRWTYESCKAALSYRKEKILA